MLKTDCGVEFVEQFARDSFQHVKCYIRSTILQWDDNILQRSIHTITITSHHDDEHDNDDHNDNTSTAKDITVIYRQLINQS